MSDDASTAGRNSTGIATGRRRALVRRALWGGAIGAVALAGFALFIDAYGQTDRSAPADAIVILGARVGEDGLPGDSLRARTLRAIELYHAGLAPRMICTGGVGDHPPSEAEAAATLAMSRGVPREALVLEDTSTSTRENAIYTARICRERGWTRLVTVSDPYHLWRVRCEFRRAGLHSYTSPAWTVERNRRLDLRAQWALREAVLALWAQLRP